MVSGVTSQAGVTPFLCPKKILGNGRGPRQSPFSRKFSAPCLKRLPPHVLLFCLTPCAGFAAEATGSSPAGQPTAPPAFHPVSAQIAAAVTASVPKYTPPPPTPAKAPPAPGSTEGIILLPKMTVTDSKVPAPTDWELLSSQGRAAYLKKRFAGYVGLGSGADAVDESKPNAAMQLMRDEKRQENLGWMKETLDTSLLAGEDKASAKKLKKEMQQALYRAYDWRTEELDQAYNNGRR